MAGSVTFKRIERLLATARRTGRSALTEPETKAILALAGISVPKETLVTSARDAVRAAHACGFPVVLKVVSPDLPHKSDVGGVQLGLESPEAVRRAHRQIVANVRARSRGARIDGVLVQPQLRGLEVILGATHDPQFGPVILFGVGGVHVETMNDVAFRLIPLDRRNARAMLDDIKAARLLDGVRGSAPVSKRSIVSALVRLSALMTRFPDVIQEIDINPMLATADEAVAVDAMAVIASGVSQQSTGVGSSGPRRQAGKALTPFFSPRSVAVVGASATKGKAGYFLLKNILDGAYEGRVYPVNPGARRILGRKSYPSVLDIPEAPDLAILVVSNAHVAPVLRECAKRQVKAVTIVSAGFGETGEAGRESEKELAEILLASGMRAVGPNSVGLVSAPSKLVGSFVPFARWPDGPVAIASQTGIFTGAYVDELAEQQTQRVGFCRSVCLGNKIDVDEVDFLEYAARDSATRVIALHLESFRRPREFLSAAKHATQSKPVVVLKTGRTEQGARVAASHSGALASQDALVSAVLKQYGIVRADTLEEFLGVTKAFAWQPIPRGNRAGIVTLSGALGVMAVDEMHGTGLELARFTPATVRTIASLMPEWQPVQNPADVWMALGSGAEKAHEQILGAVLGDPGVDMLLCILLPIPNADFARVKEVFGTVTRAHPRKPVFLILVGGRVRDRWLRELEPLHLPVYVDPRSAVRAMDAMRFYAEQRCRICPDPIIQQVRRAT